MDSDDTIVPTSDSESCVTPLLPGLATLFDKQNLTSLATSLQDDYTSPVFPILSKKLGVKDRVDTLHTEQKEDETQSEQSEVLVNLSEICHRSKPQATAASQQTLTAPIATIGTTVVAVDKTQTEPDDSDRTQTVAFEQPRNTCDTRTGSNNGAVIVHGDEQDSTLADNNYCHGSVDVQKSSDLATDVSHSTAEDKTTDEHSESGLRVCGVARCLLSSAVQNTADVIALDDGACDLNATATCDDIGKIQGKPAEVTCLSQSTTSDELVTNQQLKSACRQAKTTTSTAVASHQKDSMKMTLDKKSPSTASSQSAHEEKHAEEVKLISKIESNLIIAADFLTSEPDDTTSSKVKDILADIRPRINELNQSQAAERTWIGNQLKGGADQTQELSARTRHLHKRQSKLVSLFRQYRNVWDGVQQLSLAQKEPVNREVPSCGFDAVRHSEETVRVVHSRIQENTTNDVYHKYDGYEQSKPGTICFKPSSSLQTVCIPSNHCDNLLHSTTWKGSAGNSAALNNADAAMPVLNTGPKQLGKVMPGMSQLPASSNNSTSAKVPVMVGSVQLSGSEQSYSKLSAFVNNSTPVNVPMVVGSVQVSRSEQCTSKLSASVNTSADVPIVVGSAQLSRSQHCTSKVRASLNNPKSAKVHAVLVSDHLLRKGLPDTSQLSASWNIPASAMLASDQLRTRLPNTSELSEPVNNCITVNTLQEPVSVQLTKHQPSTSQVPQALNSSKSMAIPSVLGSFGKSMPAKRAAPLVSFDCSNLDLLNPKRKNVLKTPIQCEDQYRQANVTVAVENAGFTSEPMQIAYLPLKDMIKGNMISPGDGVLSLATKEKMVYASLLSSGFIQSSGGEVFRTPVAWCASLLSASAKANCMKKNIAYRKVLYKSKPLADILSTSQPAPNGLAAVTSGVDLLHSGKSTATTATNTDTSPLSWMSVITHVNLMSDAELCPSFLPHDFWTADFANVALPSELVDSIQRW